MDVKHLPLPYQLKVEALKKEPTKTRVSFDVRLLDIIYAENADSVAILRKHIVKRVKAGVGRSYMTQLKLLHSVLTVFLTRAGYL